MAWASCSSTRMGSNWRTESRSSSSRSMPRRSTPEKYDNRNTHIQNFTPLGYIQQLLQTWTCIEIQFLPAVIQLLYPATVFVPLLNFSGDVLEQTGVGSRTWCWCCWWCSKVPVNVRHACGGKRFMSRLLAADGITLLQLFTCRGLFLLIAAFFFHLFFHLLVFMGLVRKTTHCSFMDALRLMSSMVF